MLLATASQAAFERSSSGRMTTWLRTPTRPFSRRQPITVIRPSERAVTLTAAEDDALPALAAFAGLAAGFAEALADVLAEVLTDAALPLAAAFSFTDDLADLAVRDAFFSLFAMGASLTSASS